MARGGWVYVGGRAGNKPPAGEKTAITSTCEKFIAEVLKPRFLPEIQPTEFNYPIAIYGNGTATSTASSPASDPTTPVRTSRNSRSRSHVSNTSAVTVLTCPTTGTRVNGSACFNVSRWQKP
jgi:hypothetical protein